MDPAAKPTILTTLRPPGDQWACSACTLFNQPSATACAACEAPRPSTGAGRGASQAAHAVAAAWLNKVQAEHAHWSPGGRSVVRMVGLAAGSICSSASALQMTGE